MDLNCKELIEKHQQALNSFSIEKTRTWWENYMKGVIPFRGVGIPKNRELLSLWRAENGISQLPLDTQFNIALAFLNEPYAEDKLAGILYIQNYLVKKISWEQAIDRYEQVFEQGLIFDWNICDWFCVRVLGPMIKHYGHECAKAISEWKNKDYIWHARSSVVPFVKVVSDLDYYPYIEEGCTSLIHRNERFCKTAVGWILRDVSKYDQQFVIDFIDSYLEFFSKESLSNALKYFEKEKRNEYIQKLKVIMKG